jgi:transcriptional regulator with XRE-family HTH domain
MLSMTNDDAYGATVAKRRLSRTLAAMRTREGLTTNEVSDKLNWNRGRLQRIEANQWRLPEPSYIGDLARVYGVPDSVQAELIGLAMHARARLWWRTYEDVFGKDNEFPGFENDATAISVYMPLVLPGLLQTRAYTREHMRAGSQPPAWRDRALEARLRRQQILSRPDTAPLLSAVITEASLAYCWGSPADRREQVEHLLATSEMPNVQVRLLRFTDGPHPGMSSLINLFDFGGTREPGIVYLETDTELHEVTDEHEVQTYKQIFRQIAAAALVPDATRDHLRSLT